jgi:hypothetical protein
MPDVSDLHLKSQCLILSIIFMYIVVPVR